MAINFTDVPGNRSLFSTATGEAFQYEVGVQPSIQGKWRRRTGYTVISSGTRPAAATQDFLLPRGYSRFKLYISNFYFTGAFGLCCLLSNNGLTGWATSNYKYAFHAGWCTGQTRASEATYGTTFIHMNAHGVLNDILDLDMGEFDIEVAQGNPSVLWRLSTWTSSIGSVSVMGFGFTDVIGNAGLDCGFRIYHPSGGTPYIGSYCLMGYK